MTRKICAALCGDCPFRRASAPGWLGESSYDPWDFLSSFDHGEAPLPCHKKVNWESDRAMELAEIAPLCRGALIMMRNEGNIPNDPEMATAVRSVEPDHDVIFSDHGEFIKHHQDQQKRRDWLSKP
jgi:hypothetical protein